MQEILDSPKVKEIADDNFKLDKKDCMFSKRRENTVGKGEIACKSNFSFSRSVFKRLALQTRENQGLFGKGLNFVYQFEVGTKQQFQRNL